MMLTELTSVPGAALPVQALKDHLRLGSGFTDDALQDGLIESYLRAAMAAIEGRIGKALIARTYKLVLQDWRQGNEQPLPVAPVSAIASVTVYDAANVATVIAADRWQLVADMARPGFLLNLVSIALITVYVYFAGPVVLKFERGGSLPAAGVGK